MELSGARVLVAGGTGVLGGLLTAALVEAGASVVVTGRRPERLAELADLTGHPPIELDVVDVVACRAAVDSAAQTLGGLDVLVVAVGVPAFGPAVEADPAVTEELFAVNTLGPMALVRAASARFDDGGKVVVLSAILADLPTNQMAEYSASKAALAAWLGVVRRENRRRFSVLDVRPPHLDTGLPARALAGEPPRLPEPMAAGDVVDLVMEAVAKDAGEVAWDAGAKALAVR